MVPTWRKTQYLYLPVAIPDLNPLPEYTDSIQFDDSGPEQHLNDLLRALALLRWRVTSNIGNVLTCNTQGGDNSLGEVVTITIDADRAVISSRSVNEYYWVDGQNQKNVELLNRAFAYVIAHKQKADKKLNPLAREKYGAFVPSRTYQVTPILIYLNVFVFLLMVLAGVSPLSPTTESLFNWGGNFRPYTVSGQWWRLVSYMFLHAGIVHIAMNLFALIYIGQFLEPLIGKFRLLAAYLLTGICAGLLSIIMHANSVGVGASGAIFGLYGIFLALLTTSHIEKTARNTLLRSILFFVVFNLVSGLYGNIDNAAHIGGLISGIFIGYCYYPGLAKRQPLQQQYKIAGIITAVIILICVFVFLLLPGSLPAIR